MSTSSNADIEKAQPAVVEKAAPLVEQQEETAVIPVTSPAQKKKKFLFALVTIMLMALAIGLGVGLSSKGSSNTTPYSENTQTPDNNRLEVLCQADADLEDCRMVCKDYMCCFYDAETLATKGCNIPSNSCGAYAPCFVLVDHQIKEPEDEDDAAESQGDGNASLPGGPTADGNTELKEPAAEVKEICNSGYMEVSNITCEEACWEANCCYWTGDESCYDQYTEICDMWRDAGCFEFSDPFGGEEATLPGGQALGAGEVLEEPDADVEIICNSDTYTEQGGVTCEEACDKAACCYWAGENSCYDDNQEVCEMWNDVGCFSFSVQHEEEDP